MAGEVEQEDTDSHDSRYPRLGRPGPRVEMAAALLKLRHPFRLLMLEGGKHDLVEYDEEVNRALKEWLDHYVRDGRTWPSLDPDRK
jgi:hypothetical protein